jgi:hypothetical protein
MLEWLAAATEVELGKLCAETGIKPKQIGTGRLCEEFFDYSRIEVSDKFRK